MMRIACLASLVVFVALCIRPAVADETATADLKRQYEGKENEAVELARQMKTTPPLAESLRAKLRITVAEAFALRQRLHQAELAEFQARMARVQQTIRTREQIKDAIIDRRIEDLLNPDLNWERSAEAEATGRSAGRMKTTPATASAATSARNVVTNSAPKQRRPIVSLKEVGMVSVTGEEGLFEISCMVPGDIRVGEELQLYRGGKNGGPFGWIVVVELKDQETAIGRTTEMPRVAFNYRYGPYIPQRGDRVFRPIYAPDTPYPEGDPNTAHSLPEAKAARSPRIVRSIPAMGATNVDSGITEISVTFDQDMSKGINWTGNPQLYFPPSSPGKSHWVDARTCVLPVKLEQGRYYRVGINSTDQRNFRSLDDVPALPSVLRFATAGAAAEVAAWVSAPVVVAIEPKDGADDVDPAVNAIRVTFNMPMGDGMSWTGAGEKYPEIRPGVMARWSADGLTCVLPVALEPGHDYELGLNNLHQNNFQSQWGVPLELVVYKFRTRGGAP
jgi:hypothetical protein